MQQEESGVTVHQGPSWEVGPSAARALKLQLSALKYFNYSSMVWYGMVHLNLFTFDKCSLVFMYQVAFFFKQISDLGMGQYL